MLSAAQARRREGVDVVIGIVETHGRAGNGGAAGRARGAPAPEIDYKGRALEEMDLDALLARRPALALVDELAHSNAPGSRHPKRYMDVEELLAAGIDVWTTLNIQHVESLNDVVARITRIRVRETVPDAVIDRADEIEVVDLTPDDLMQRLREGKVYVPQQAERALGHYFSPGNLTALRELALRRTAQRVDAQMLDHMQAHAISGPWAAGERVLVCVSGGRRRPALVRYGRRLAERLRAPWTALYVETAARMPARPRRRARPHRRALRLAERLGGETVTIPGQRRRRRRSSPTPASNNFTHMVVGKSAGAALARAGCTASVTTELIARAGDIAMHVVGGVGRGRRRRGAAAKPATPQPPRPEPYRRQHRHRRGGAAGRAGAATILAVANVSLVFLTAVLVAAAAFGLWPSLFACLISVLAYNFFFLPPLYTFTIADPENVVALFFFLLTALIASNLAAGMRAQAWRRASGRAPPRNSIASAASSPASSSWTTCSGPPRYQIAAMLKVRVVLLLPEGESIAVRAGYPPEDELDEADLAAAMWCWKQQPRGRPRRRHAARRASGCSCRCAPPAARSACSASTATTSRSTRRC